MQEAAVRHPGEMMAVLGLASDEVGRICAEIEAPVWPANFNAPQQTVVAGEREALQQAAAELRAAGAGKLVSLPVSVPFHCPLMTPAMEKLATALAETPFRSTRVPVISNVTAEPYSDADQARSLLQQQVCAPVRWVECVRTLCRGGVRAQLEIGPGRVLSGLAGRIERGLRSASVAEPEDLTPALRGVSEALA